ncbi:MAG: hypothetical protein GY829_12140 [Gammaproteobacteria bacterium]|nr:hypothetical protein [Gammaproteobacteria bacterium]
MLRKFMEGFSWSLGFFTVAAVSVYILENYEDWGKVETEKVELKGFELLSMNVDRANDQMIFAGQFKSKTNEQFDRYSIEIDLFTEEGKFVSSCERYVDSDVIEDKKKFNYTLNCEVYSEPKSITKTEVKLYGKNEE